MPDGVERKVVATRTGLVPWSRAAFTVLQETAARYNATITQSELAGEVQRRTGLFTTAQPRSWVGHVLRPLAVHCHREGLPPLTALVVHQRDGRVGDSYVEMLEVTGQPPIDDDELRERHAAGARLECYRYYCAEVPTDAVPTLAGPRRVPPRSASGAGRAARDRSSPGPQPVAHASQRVCTSCFLEMPATGVCPNCDE